MQENAELLTTAEAAAYLRLKERKLYELVSQGAIPCTKATGRWLFPKAELDRWLASSVSTPDGFSAAAKLPVVGGSNDPLLDWALRESGSGLATLPEGSEAGLARLAAREVVAAAIHLHALEDDDIDANMLAMRRDTMLRDAVLLAFARREQGLIVAAGNPLQIDSVETAVARGARFAMRPDGAGARLLLLGLLHRAGLALDRLTCASPLCPTGSDIAQAIRAGRADCGIAQRSVANAAALGFLPIAWERFDLVVRARDYFHTPWQKFAGFLRDPAFAEHARELGGYDVSEAGAVRYAP